MTRINVVPVDELCDEHLRAEHRELTRIPNGIASGKLSGLNAPKSYTVRTEDNPEGGKGHVKFFYDKLGYLYKRYNEILKELDNRGFKSENRWPTAVFNNEYQRLWNNYDPTKEALSLNRRRIQERWPKNTHYYSEKV